MRLHPRLPWSTSGWELALVVGLVIVALAVRLPNLLWAPAYTDESREVLWAVDIYRGRHWPLTGCDPYLGPIFPYLLAALFHAVGLSLILPRLTVAVFSALVVAAVYWLARL